jgi:DNA-binding SARP family transcriptional activator/tetratricopeptide (TPR) repeat protein
MSLASAVGAVITPSAANNVMSTASKPCRLAQPYIAAPFAAAEHRSLEYGVSLWNPCDLEFRLLGPVEVWGAGRQVDAGQPRQRGVLAALLVDAGRLVTWASLVDRVWGDAPPGGAREALYAHVARIRRVLHKATAPGEKPPRLVTQPGGYVLGVDADQVDLHRFRGLAQRAREPDLADADRVALLRQAIDLWRGEPLAGLRGPWAARVREAWHQERLDTVVAWAHAELATGNPTAAIGPLTDLLEAYPLVEPVTVALMRTLHAAGHTAQALHCYATTRQLLIDELGAEPRAELRAAHRSILRGDPDPWPADPRRRDATAAHSPSGGPGSVGGHPEPPRPGTQLAVELGRFLTAAQRRAGGRGALKRTTLARRVGVSVSSLYAYLDGTTVPSAPVLDRLLAELGVTATDRARLATARDMLEKRRRLRAEPAPPVPRHLPPDIGTFAGRAAELTELDKLLSDSPAAVVISVLVGMAGVGKTALAVHWAHRVADRFPDGQLYVDLRGFDPTGAVSSPCAAVRELLDALGVPPRRIPVHAQAQVNLYRSLLADRRMLVILDNARDAEQVRPLLPGAPQCLVLVTSRNRLSGLIAAEGAQPVMLDVLSPAEARQLLAGRLGTVRVGLDPAVDQIVEECGRLPLALAVVAANAATRRWLPLAELAAELRAAHGSLEAFAGGDAATDVRTVFSWTYRALSGQAAMLYRLLCVHPGLDITAPAVASLGGLSLPLVRPPLAELTAAHLLTEHAGGRYTLHDLLRSHAAELSAAQDTDGRRREALHRLLDHYLHTAHAASTVLDAHREPIALKLPRPGSASETFADRRQAMAWFEAEHQVLLAAVRQAADNGFDGHAWQLAWTLVPFLRRQGHWRDWADTQTTALAAAQRLADPVRQVHAHRAVGLALVSLGADHEALTHFRAGLDILAELDSPIAEGNIHLAYGCVFERRGDYGQALEHASRAVELFQTAGHRAGLARALNNAGWCHANLRNHRTALAFCRHALALLREMDDNMGEADTLASIGYVHGSLGDHARAVDCYQSALTLFRRLGERHQEADTLDHLGDVRLAAGEPDAARESWLTAMSIFDELGQVGADQVRAKLGRLP